MEIVDVLYGHMQYDKSEFEVEFWGEFLKIHEAPVPIFQEFIYFMQQSFCRYIILDEWKHY